MRTSAPSLRPFLPRDTLALRELFAASIEELTQEDYDEDQRVAWVSVAADEVAFGKLLGGMLTLIAEVEGELAGFGSLKGIDTIEMLYVHPFHAGDGVGTVICEALERLAAGRGAKELTVEASETAVIFFEGRGYKATSRNSVPRDDLWLVNTTMKKVLKPAGSNA